MSMEAQYYEAKRRQHILERRQSLRTQDELDKQIRKVERQPIKPFKFPTRVYRQEIRPPRCTCTPMEMIVVDDSEPVIFQRSRDIYPRPKTTATAAPTQQQRQYYRRDARLPNRFTSTEYRQQW
ncbi:hypothetical protein I4U23_001133 [Adineta vaga]|nr:hypothetical protein I4U23_001133 [Adineta vaga]